MYMSIYKLQKPIQMINTRKITFLNSEPNRVCACWYTGIDHILSNWFSIFGRNTVFAASFGLSFRIIFVWASECVTLRVHRRNTITNTHRYSNHTKHIGHKNLCSPHFSSNIIMMGIVFACFFSIAIKWVACVFEIVTHTNMHIAYIFRHIAVVIMETIQI